MERYSEYLSLLAQYKEGKIDIKSYKLFLKEAIKKILFTDEEMIENFNEAEKINNKPNQLIKKPKNDK